MAIGTLDYEPHITLPRREEQPLSALQEEVLELKRKYNAVILAHNYQVEEIQRVADYVGDSLGLSYRAAEAEGDVIVFCGVHFMAETAKIVNPTKKVLLPDLEAGCSLADSCPADKLQAYQEAHPGLYTIAYINCSAAVKARTDVICTSGNAMNIVTRANQIVQDSDEYEGILFVPDQNLGQWISKETGVPMKLWPGSCYAHVLFTRDAIEKVRTRFPNAPVVAHPECVEAVRDMADEVCSTEKMIAFAQNHPSDTIIVVTESGMLHRLRREVPEKTFVAGPTDSCACNDCRFMKMNTIEKLRNALRDQQPEITMDETIRKAAFTPIQRMLDWSR